MTEETGKELEETEVPKEPAEVVEYIRISLVKKVKGSKKSEELHTEKIETPEDFAALAKNMASDAALRAYLRDDEVRMTRRKNAKIDARIAALKSEKR